jgi:hypothetical protein
VGSPLGLMGRQVVGREFLKAYLGHGSWTELVALVRNRQSVESLKLFWGEQPWSRRGRALRILDERQFHDASPRPRCSIYPVHPTRGRSGRAAPRHPTPSRSRG